MAFADFSLESAVERFELTLPPRADLFAGVEAMEIPPVLQAVLERWAPQALEVNTEKARSELIIAPILMEAMHLAGMAWGSTRGSRWTWTASAACSADATSCSAVDPVPSSSARRCWRSSRPRTKTSRGTWANASPRWWPCASLNERKGHPIPVVHGAVTTGAEWLFLQLEGNAVIFDLRERFLDDAGRILGYLAAIGGLEVAGAERPLTPPHRPRGARPRPGPSAWRWHSSGRASRTCRRAASTGRCSGWR